MEFDPFKVNVYSFEELKEFLNSKTVSFSDLQNAGLKYDMQARVKQWMADKDKIADEDNKFWELASRKNTVEAYQMYLNQWADGLHVDEAKFEMVLLENKRKEMLQELLDDLKANPWRYRQEEMKFLLNGNPTDAQRQFLEANDSPMSRFVLAGMKLQYGELINNRIIPDSIKQSDLLAPDYTMPATQIKELGEFPQNRTDVYFLGVPRSGKSSVLSGITYTLWKDGRAGYEPQLVGGKDPCLQYYEGLRKAIASKKPPKGTANDTVSFMKINICDKEGKKENPVTIVELSGEAFRQLARRHQLGCDMWAELGATQCITNANRKMLFFVLDYSLIAEKNSEAQCTEMDQLLVLEAALNVFTTDGPDKHNPHKNCTMSKVDSVAIIMTKSDLMDIADHDGRLDEACRYIDNRFKSFMNSLLKYCKKFGINEANDYSPYILTFSLGKFHIGNTVLFNDEDSEEIIEFISSVTKGTKVSRWGRIFG